MNENSGKLVSMIPTDDIGLYKYNTNVVTGRNLSSLRESIKRDGILEPLLVARLDKLSEMEKYDIVFTKLNDGSNSRELEYIKYVAIDGNHRLAIAQTMGIRELPCIAIDVTDVDMIMKLSLNINSFRGETSVEKLSAFITHQLSTGVPIKKLAETLGMTEWWIMQHVQWAQESGRTESRVIKKRRLIGMGMYLPVYFEKSDFDYISKEFGLIAERTDLSLFSRKLSVFFCELIQELRKAGVPIRYKLAKLMLRMGRLEKELNEKPQLMSRWEVLKMIDKFCADLQSSVHETTGNRTLQKNTVAYNIFRSLDAARDSIRSDAWWKRNCVAEGVKDG